MCIRDRFRSDEPYLGLYGAFGYDLVLQFEKLEQRHARPEDQRDCHLFLPTDLVVVDRQKELAYSICYRIYTRRLDRASPEYRRYLSNGLWAGRWSRTMRSQRR